MGYLENLLSGNSETNEETDTHILMRLRQEEETIRLNRDVAYARYERLNRELRDMTHQINDHLDRMAAKQ